MVRSFKNLEHALRELPNSDWENCVPLRWLAQMSAGILPGLVVLALLIKTAHDPLPTRDGTTTVTNVASIIPLLSASGVSESANFHRLQLDQNVAASDEVHFRYSSHLQQAQPVLTASAVAEPPMAHDFSSPRTGWQLLDQQDRAAIDALMIAKDTASTDVVLHGTRETDASPQRLGRYLSEIRSAAPGACDILITPQGVEVLGTATSDGPLDILLTGDFQIAPPAKEQLAALDEVLDYLAMKTDRIHLLQHLHENDSLQAPCLGRHFPFRQITAVVASLPD